MNAFTIPSKSCMLKEHQARVNTDTRMKRTAFTITPSDPIKMALSNSKYDMLQKISKRGKR